MGRWERPELCMPKSLKHIEADFPLVVLADMTVLQMTLRDWRI